MITINIEDFKNFFIKPVEGKNKIEEIKEESLPVVLWGCGSLAHSVKKFLELNQIELFACMVDNVEQELVFEGVPVYSAKHIDEMQKEIILVMGHSRYDLRESVIQKCRCVKKVYYFCNICYEQYEPIPYTYIMEQAEKYCNAYNSLRDEYSRACFIAYLNARMNDDITYIEDIFKGANSYFDNDLFTISADESFVDCGAYIGDSIREFLEKNHGKYNSIYAFEPEADSFRQLLEYVEEEKIERINTYQYGCYNKNERLYFSEKQEGSVISQSMTDNSIDVVRLDTVLPEQQISILKINYMTCVRETLDGAEAIIRRWHPKLAVVVGFDKMTVVEVIDYLEQINSQYEEVWGGKYLFGLRYNAVMPSRLVLYGKFVLNNMEIGLTFAR